MTTKELSQRTGVPAYTIRRLAEDLDGLPIGGRHGYEFPEKAEIWLRDLLRERHRARCKPRKLK